MKSIFCDKVYLVHATTESKLEFKEVLEEAYSEMCRSTRVIATNKGTVGYL